MPNLNSIEAQLENGRGYSFGENGDLPAGTYNFEVKYDDGDSFEVLKQNSNNTCLLGARGTSQAYHNTKIEVFGDVATIEVNGTAKIQKLTFINDYVPPTESDACDSI